MSGLPGDPGRDGQTVPPGPSGLPGNPGEMGRPGNVVIPTHDSLRVEKANIRGSYSLVRFLLFCDLLIRFVQDVEVRKVPQALVENLDPMGNQDQEDLKVLKEN